MRRRVAVLGTLLTFLAASCADPTAPGPGPGPRWRPGAPQYGINIYWGDDATSESRDDLLFKTRAVLDYAKGLHANSIAIAFPFTTAGPHADSVEPMPRTPSAPRLRLVADEVVRQGFRLTVRPLMDEANLITAHLWRGAIEPADRDAWFQSYEAFLDPYLSVARQAGVTTFDIGSEIDSLAGDPRWAGLIARARTRFPGEIAYAQSWGDWELGAPTAPVPVAVDAYPVMPQLADSATPDQVLSGWTAWLAGRPGGSAALHGVVLQEVGLPAQSGAYAKPYSWNLAGHRLDPTLQARWFAAACRAQRAAGMGGIYYWSIDLRRDPALPARATDPPGLFVGRPAENEIRNCFDGSPSETA